MYFSQSNGTNLRNYESFCFIILLTYKRYKKQLTWNSATLTANNYKYLYSHQHWLIYLKRNNKQLCFLGTDCIMMYCINQQ